MNKIISSSEIIGSFTQGKREIEVCATGEADFDDTKAQLQIELDSFIRAVDIRVKEEHLAAEWLPKKQTLRESVSREEAPELAKEIFHRWVCKVRQSVPLLMHT